MSVTAMVDPQIKTVVARPFHKLDVDDDNPPVAVKETKENLELMRQAANKQANSEVDSLSPAEATWEKRYGDLRRYEQKNRSEFKKRISDLEASIAQLKATPKEGQIVLPKSPQELQAWAKQYPESFDVVKTMIYGAGLADQGSVEALQAQVKALEEKLQISDEQKALAELRAAITDFDELQHSKEFHSWVQAKPQREKVIYESQDVDAIVDMIQAYKASAGITEKPKGKPKAAQTNVEAALAVTSDRTRAPEPGSEGRIWRASEVRRMTPREYEKFEDEIDEARRTPGRWIEDVKKI